MGLWYEALWVWKGGIFSHQLQLMKPLKSERRNSVDERHEGAKTELMMIAASKIDWLIESRSIKSLITKHYGKATAIFKRVFGEGASVPQAGREQ